MEDVSIIKDVIVYPSPLPVSELIGLCRFFGLKMGEGSLQGGEFTSTKVKSLQT